METTDYPSLSIHYLSIAFHLEMGACESSIYIGMSIGIVIV